MVLQKRLDYGFNGYQVPPTPRAARSARRRGINRRITDDSQMCAFDLLATLAGKLLLEGESSPSSTDMGSSGKDQYEASKSLAKEGMLEENKHVSNFSNQDCSDRSFIVSELVLQAPSLNNCPKELAHTQNDACSGPTSAITTSECSEKVGSAERLLSDQSNFQHGKADIELFGCRVSPGCKLDGEKKRQIKVEPNDLKLSICARDDICNSESPIAWDRKPSCLVSSDESVKSLSRDHIPSGSLPHNRENVNLVTRDDDENSSGCTQPSTVNNAFRPSSHIGDRRIRKLLASKYWKVTPNLKDGEHFKTVMSSDADMKYVHHDGKNGFKRQRSQRDFPFKKRKLYHCSSLSNLDGDICTDEMYNSPGKFSNRDACASMLPKVTGPSISGASEHAAFKSKDSQVKLKIKSFRVPEFFIEIPETATVGSLKKTVMEAVTAILSGELRVGVLLQGKKIRDDNKTLLQTGISHDNKLDALGFTLEPNLSQAPPPVSLEDHPFLLSCDSPQPLSRYPPTPSTTANAALLRGTSDASPDPPGTNLSNLVESDHDSAPSPPEMSLEKSTVDSRALVAVPAMNVEALSVVPMRKSKRSEAAQRRIRRPFSVSEVEALVQAVEKLGTGRWRDVKLRAFDNAKHRTYVDLKDKWKTLVHTARISPQQRRGEPVPQELLDRVLTAHAYWSQQQVKPQFKQQSEACRLLST
ncbi:unnamed protein product [Coffea canephora]|uniref:HTH myb-type domain-containing protein n=2 Tax=Coffea TaxID=13442 RepID=A0A068UL86_COFCA|nr:unnamed protein product [Coffea canephora]